MRNGILQLGDVGRDPNEAGDFEHCSEGCVSSEEAVAPPPAEDASNLNPLYCPSISAWRINPTLSAECPVTFPEGDVREV